METVTSADGTSIAYDQYGSGPAVILVGGAFQHRAIDPSTAELAELLASRFTVFHYDRRGRGDSGKGNTQFTIEREIEDLGALIEAAGGQAALFGMSSGAALALDTAARRPAVTKVAVYEAPFVVDGDPELTSEEYLPQLHALLAKGDNGGAVEWFLTGAVGVPSEVVAGMRHAPIWAVFESVAPTLAYDGALLEGTVEGKPLSDQRWAAVTAPVLVLDGGDSPPSMAAAAEGLVSVLSDARRGTLPGQTHEVDPKVLRPVLLDFFLTPA
jgi:pimeloyl-ACP methyl ester carboxylesterase